MFLKRLQILGFKSFADKTTIDFADGVTAVVGPNGSGKSNIGDAMIWVLGESNARTLRADSSSEVIFAGSTKRKPLGMAEVSLTIDNTARTLPTDFAEVTVTRRVYRSGESEFLINKSPCRLKDIQELFMDTGVGRSSYAILTQSEVDAVLSAKPEERRMLFEEAAGIQKYRNRKREALRRLENTEANLNRVIDILGELDVQREPMRVQAEIASRYLTLSDRLKQIEVDSLWAQWVQAEQSRQEAETQGQLLHKSVLQLNEQMTHCEADSRRLAAEIAHLDTQIDTLRVEQQRLITEIERGDGTRRLSEERIHNAQTNSETLQAEITELQARQSANTAQLAVLRQQAQELQAQHQTAVQACATAKQSLTTAQRVLQEAQLAELSRAQEVSKLRTQLSNLQQREAEHRQSQQRIVQAQDELSTREEQMLQAVAQSDTIRQTTQDSLTQFEADIKALEEQIQKDRAAISKSQEAWQQSARQNAALAARLQALVESEAAQEGLFGGVKAVLDGIKKLEIDGNYQLVVDIMRPFEEFVTAIEVALGASAQDIVCPTQQEARTAINWLKQNSRGRATFLPMDSIQPNIPPKELDKAISEGLAIGYASDLVSIEPGFQDVAAHLLGRVVVAVDYDAAVKISQKYNGWARIVTPEGELFTPGGAVTGGKMPGKATGIVSRKAEKTRTEQLLATGRDQEAKHKQSTTSANEWLNKHDTELKTARQGLSQMQSELMKQEREHQSATQRLETVRRDKQSGEARIASITQQLADLSPQIELIKQQLEHLDDTSPSAVNPTAELQAAREGAAQISQQAEVDLSRIQEQQRSLAREDQALLKAIADASAQLQLRQERLRKLSQGSEADEKGLIELSIKLADLKGQRDQVDANLSQKRVARAERSEKSQANNASVRELVRKQQSNSDQQHQLQLQLARLEVQHSQLVTRLWEDYDIDANQGPPADFEAPPKEVQSEINRLRRDLRSMGNVNVGAVEEYNRISERFDFLTKQHEDLNLAKANVLQAIQEIDHSTRDLFTNTFLQVQDAFSKIFTELFGGGEAQLTLTMPDNPLETGVDIYVEPPGKRRQNLNLLSGGERSLTASALLFAFMTVKPSPFCTLDEVDAAMDGANVERFADLLKSFSLRSQVIVITHNASTMERADSWYGVTMQEPGVSSIISYKAPLLQEQLSS